MRRIRESFAAKLLAALLGTVGLLLLFTLVVVRAETAWQVDLVADRAVRAAERQFADLTDLQRQLAERLAGPLVEGSRALARLEAAIADRDLAYVAGEVVYEIELAGLEQDVLVAFTDARGDILFTVLGGQGTSQDPADIEPIAGALLESTDFERSTFRVAGGRLYGVLARVIEAPGRPVLGTVSFGLPILDSDVERIGSLVGVEVCLVADGACVAGTSLARDSLSSVLVGAAGRSEPLPAQAMDTDWSVRSAPLVASDPGVGSRVVAVPLDQVVAPFARITRALFLGGSGALLLAVLVGAAIARGLTRPVHALVAATGRISEGDYEAEVSVDSVDEIGTLADAFNDMSRGLRLKEQYRSVLNKVVSREVAEELLRGDVVLGGENRRITVLFADIRGFTTLTDGMEPQEVIGLLNGYMERLSRVVDREGGIVDKFVGDELMAVFGAPVSQGEDALAAVRAAVGMQRAIEELNAERGARGEAPIGIGIGVSTGVAVAGNMGSPDRLNYTVLGDIVNLGARLCSGAAAGEVLISERTREEAGVDVRVESRGSQSFKGFAADIEVFRVLGVEDPGAGVAAVGGTGSGAEGQPDGGAGPGEPGAGEPGAGESAAAESGAAESEAGEPDAGEPRATGSGAGESAAAESDAGEPDAGGARGPGGARGAGSLGALLLALAAAVAPPPAAAQGDWPILADAGLGYLSGSVQIDLSGRLDLELFGFSGHDAGLAYGMGFLAAHRLRLFTDVFLGERLYGLLELRTDRGEAPTEGEWHARVEQAFVRLSSRSGALSAQLGRFASPFGSYPARHLGPADPFVRPPLPYDYRTVVSRVMAPGGPDGFLGWKDEPARFRTVGGPPVWGVPYQWGILLAGQRGRVSLRAAAMSAAPSSEVAAWGFDPDRFEHPSWVAGVDVRVAAELTLSASYDRGPFAEPELAAELPAGRSHTDFEQELLALGATWARGPLVVRAEAIHDRWDVPNLSERPSEWGYSFELQTDVAAGVSLSGRLGILDFGTIRDGAGVQRPWDHDVVRWEGGVGYRIARNAGALASYMHTRQRTGVDPDDDLLALRLWWAF